MASCSREISGCVYERFDHDIQDVQEVVHYERKDLMKVNRVEFHAQRQYVPWIRSTQVEELVANLAKWDTKAVAITDGIISIPFPHGYKAAKLVFNSFMGWEANIVRRPCSYRL